MLIFQVGLNFGELQYALTHHVGTISVETLTQEVCTHVLELQSL